MATLQSPILPGATLGILGNGQLGRMLAIAARELGYRVHVYGPDADSPAGQVADLEVCAAYEDFDRVRAFASQVDLVTFEFENVPSLTSRAAAEVTQVRPDGQILHITQNRLREKRFLSEHGFPVAKFQAIQTLSDLDEATQSIGYPAVLKTASFGYDGKGQQKLTSPNDLSQAWENLQGAEGVLEAWVPFDREISVVAARTQDGQFAAYPVFENRHAHHILDVTLAPALLPPDLAQKAVEMARGILEALNVEGLLTVELFVTIDGKLVVNELAPRTHNSGHLTLDACATSQFEQQLRAVCGLPLGSTDLVGFAAMANLLGDVWIRAGGQPDWPAALEDPGIKLHLYGKAEARAGRKMGHLTTTGSTSEDVVNRVLAARDRLSRAPRSRAKDS
jgi:5-(carboxyamino)imidazole ribonucleotide synthase